ncbi:MAG: hypothetical protein ACO1PZ_08480 [Gammaproteobacteria bacterium]
MKLISLVPAVIALSSSVLFAQDTGDTASAEYGSGEHPDFAAADTDKDGLLSISELQAALPDVQITDSNADGFVNQSEAEEAISGLAFETNGYTGGSSLVSEPEYGLLVSTLEDDDSSAGASDAGDSGETGVNDDSVN